MKKIFDVIYLEINDIRDIININNKYYYYYSFLIINYFNK